MCKCIKTFMELNLTRVCSVKTKVQQRALAGDRYRGVWETLHRLIRGMQCSHITFTKFLRSLLGPDPANPKPLLSGVARIYRGLGVSAVRSITTHGLLWTLFDYVANYIDHLPRQPEGG
jgi:solute carrier family 25 carnitine/acylcarnitine transporter 20/29